MYIIVQESNLKIFLLELKKKAQCHSNIALSLRFIRNWEEIVNRFYYNGLQRSLCESA